MQESSYEFRSFGRRRGRKLRPLQADIVRQWIPRLGISLDGYGSDGQSTSADLSGLFKDTTLPLHLEIGFGNGEYLWHRVQLQPHINFIGAEPFEYGVAKFLMRLADTCSEAYPSNVRIYNDDARALLDVLPAGCIDRVDIMFPDPWPKGRHHRRRLIQNSLLQRLRRVLKSGAALHIATDHAQYLQSILILMQRQSDFCWMAQSAEDWREPWFGLRTRYAEKAARDGRQGYYLHYRYQV